MTYRVACSVVHELCRGEAPRRCIISVLKDLLENFKSRLLIYNSHNDVLLQTFEVENVPLLCLIAERLTKNASHYWKAGLNCDEQQRQELIHQSTIFPLIYQYILFVGSFSGASEMTAKHKCNK
jgi:hypothetical protein